MSNMHTPEDPYVEYTRLINAALFSLAIHALALALSPQPYFGRQQTPHLVFQASLAKPSPSLKQAIRDELIQTLPEAVFTPQVASNAKVLDAEKNPNIPDQENLAGALHTQAQFLTPPDLSPLSGLESANLPRLVLRIHVSAIGKITRIEVREKRNISTDFLELAIIQVSASSVSPAQSKTGPIPSHFDVVIGAEPIENGSGQSKITSDRPAAGN